MNPTHIQILLKILDLLALGLKLAPELLSKYNQSRDLLNQLVEENRNPTQSEWEALEQEITLLQQALYDNQEGSD